MVLQASTNVLWTAENINAHKKDRRKVLVQYGIKQFVKLYINHETPVFELITFQNTENRADHATHSGVFLMNFEVFTYVVKHCFYDNCRNSRALIG